MTACPCADPNKCAVILAQETKIESQQAEIDGYKDRWARYQASAGLANSADLDFRDRNAGIRQ